MAPEQSSAARVAGKNFRTFHYRGMDYILSQPLTMGSYAEEESIVLWKRSDKVKFLQRVVMSLGVQYHQGALNACALAENSDIPSEEEWTAYRASLWSKAYMLWTCLDPKHKVDPQTNRPLNLFDGLPWVMAILRDAIQFDETSQLVGKPGGKFDELMLKCRIVSQEEAIKNWFGPTDHEPDRADKEETDSPKPSATEDGHGSLNTSPESTEECAPKKFSDSLLTRDS